MEKDMVIAVIGTGAMGKAIASTLLNNGYKTVVWNRTPEKTEILKKIGAIVADSFNDAVIQSDYIFLVVDSCNTTLELLNQIVDIEKHKKFINLVTCNPEQVEKISQSLKKLKANLINGVICSFPRYIGQKEAKIILASEHIISQELEEIIKKIFPNLINVGKNIVLPNLINAITASTFFIASAAFLNSLKIIEKYGINIDTIKPYINLGNVIDYQLEKYMNEISISEFRDDEAKICVYYDASKEFLKTFEDLNIDNPYLKTFINSLINLINHDKSELSLSSIYNI